MKSDEIHHPTGNSEQSDDITMFSVEFPGETIILENRIDQLPLLSVFVRDMCGKYGVAKEIVGDVDIAVDELGSNIVLYAYPREETHTFHTFFHCVNGELTITFVDEGVPFDPTRPTETHLDLPPEERPLGGLGIMMVKELMDKVEYQRKGGKNILRIAKRFAGATPDRV